MLSSSKNSPTVAYDASSYSTSLSVRVSSATPNASSTTWSHPSSSISHRRRSRRITRPPGRGLPRTVLGRPTQSFRTTSVIPTSHRRTPGRRLEGRSRPAGRWRELDSIPNRRRDVAQTASGPGGRSPQEAEISAGRPGRLHRPLELRPFTPRDPVAVGPVVASVRVLFDPPLDLPVRTRSLALRPPGCLGERPWPTPGLRNGPHAAGRSPTTATRSQPRSSRSRRGRTPPRAAGRRQRGMTA
jgi:hypothetical protein